MLSFNLPAKARRDFYVLLVAIPMTWYLLVRYDFFESVASFSRNHEVIQLDEALTLLIVAGLFGYVFTWRRVAELSAEMVRRIQAEKDALHLAYHDQLTGLLNRRALVDRFEGTCLLEEQERLIIALVDLNCFKHINDIYGHQAGDNLLQHVARLLTQHFPERDSVYRLSGDEFVLIMNSCEPDAVIQAQLEYVAAVISQPVVIGRTQTGVSAAFGVSRFPDDGGELGTLLRRADIALHQAKKSKAASVRLYSQVLDHAFEEQAQIEEAIRRGLANGHFVPYFQPIYELPSRRIVGFEVLARLHDPLLGSIPPARFIEVAEKTGLIYSVSDVILRQATQQAAQFPEALYIAFNLSPLQLMDPELISHVLGILRESGFPPARLELEITESVLIDPDVDVARLFEQLRAQGISIAIDDFGTGYSSLARLADFSFDKIKIDRAFVQSLERDTKGERVVETLLGLCRGLNALPLAEGVEDPQQEAWLNVHGVSLVQGFLYSKPLPVAQILPLLEVQMVSET